MPVQPRPLSLAGHAADVLGDTLYVAGGGNNTSGCTDLVSLNLSPLGQANGEAKPLQWAVAIQSEARAPTASEGLSLVTSPSSRSVLLCRFQDSLPTNCQRESEAIDIIIFFQVVAPSSQEHLKASWSLCQSSPGPEAAFANAALPCALTLWA